MLLKLNKLNYNTIIDSFELPVYLSMMKENWNPLPPILTSPPRPSCMHTVWETRTQHSLLSSLTWLYYLTVFMNSPSYSRRFLPRQITWLFKIGICGKAHQVFSWKHQLTICVLWLGIPDPINPEPALNQMTFSTNLMLPHWRHWQSSVEWCYPSSWRAIIQLCFSSRLCGSQH